MDEKHPEKIDCRPKRRKDQNNPYTLYTTGISSEHPHFYISFYNHEGEQHHLEIEKALFDALDKFELEDLSFLNEMDNHYEQSELSTESLYLRAATPPDMLEDVVFQKIEEEQLHIAISKLPEVQRKRLILYYFSGCTYEEIAKQEGCSKIAIKKSIDGAIKNLRKFFLMG